MTLLHAIAVRRDVITYSWKDHGTGTRRGMEQLSRRMTARSEMLGGFHAGSFLNKWRSSPPVSLSLKGNIIGRCGTICYAIVHGERTQLKPVWYSGYLRRLFNAYERSGVRFSLLHFFSVYK